MNWKSVFRFPFVNHSRSAYYKIVFPFFPKFFHLFSVFCSSCWVVYNVFAELQSF